MDINEASHALTDPVNQESAINNAPYVFIKIPILLGFQVYANLALILDMRVRRGLSTIFLFDGYINDLERFDSKNIIRTLSGTGLYNTIDVHNFYKLSEDSEAIEFDNLMSKFTKGRV